MQSVSLHCLAGPLRGQVFRLNGGPVFLFGRSSKAHFSLAADPAASYLHFLIDISEGRIRIVDLGSTNGLVINEKHVGGRQKAAFNRFVPLKNGDSILAGACLFRVSVMEEPTPSGLGLAGEARENGAAPDSDGQFGVGVDGRLTAVISKDGAVEHAAEPEQDRDEAPTLPGFSEDSLPVVDGFAILEKIGGGGKGGVYKAIKDDTGAFAAIKMLLFNRNKRKKQRCIEMFRREIQITKQLSHPNIIRYLGDGVTSGAPYLAIEYVEGGNLDELIRSSPGGRLDPPQAIPLFLQLLEAVTHMHGRSLVHRDIKPKNILLDMRRGGSFAVKLSDMGLSCRFSSLDSGEFLPIVSEGGTPAYMPPEQLTNLTRAIPQSDVFSAAATLYHMLTGSLLYDFTDREHTEAILEGNIRPILEVRPDLPEGIAGVIAKGLSYAPEDRYANAQEMLGAFRQALA